MAHSINYLLDTEVDPTGKIVRAESVIQINGIQKNLTGYEYFDYGSGAFVDFTHKFQAQLRSTSTNTALGAAHLLSNAIGSDSALLAGLDHYVSVRLNNAAGSLTVLLVEGYNGAISADVSAGLSLDTAYWYSFKYIKSSRVLSCQIYSDVNRTVLVDTLTLTLQTSVTWRYRYSFNNYGAGTSALWDGFVAATFLEETISPAIFSFFFNGNEHE